MAIFNINSNPSYKPAPYASTYYKEIMGAQIQPFLRAPKWDKADSIDILANRTVDGTGNTKDQVSPEMVYIGRAGERVIGLIIGQIQSPKRAFAVLTGQEGFDKLLAELKANKGFLNAQIEEVGKVLTSNDAQSLYAWEENFFGNVSKVAYAKMAAPTANTRAVREAKKGRVELIDLKRAGDLITQVAKKYEIYNIEFKTMKFDGKTLGFCAPRDDSGLWLSRPTGITICLAEDVLLAHTVLHEMAHAVEVFRTGMGGHGKGFRTIYKTLLRQFLGISATGL
ncbi:hypothetical protein EVB87_254 [Rhizobium phage RHph_N28_1]|nr:hypothetical protein EVB87_254 [Rhizobium phage RHph_N28_1]QIG74283.1 hypothetical protein EVC07_255 [Rhizobium phage RHph_N42]